MPQPPAKILRNPDGSIDTAHYIALGRLHRARQAGHIARALRPRRPLRALLIRLGGALWWRVPRAGEGAPLPPST